MSMATRSTTSQVMNGMRAPFDDTHPFTCVIESSQLVEGHGEYSIRVSRVSIDPSRSWLINKRFSEFDELNTMLKEFGFEFELPRKKLLGSTERTFMAERQRGLQSYIDLLVQQTELCNSFLIQRFLDPDNHQTNHSELALQYVSMFIRSMNNVYQIVEQLPDFGWRYSKIYFLATKTGAPKDDRYLITWCPYGLDKAFGEKDINNCLKLLKSISHPMIIPILEVYANDSGVLTVCQYHSKGSLKDYLHQTRPNSGSYWKRYSRRTPKRRCDLNQIKIFGRQILEIQNFLYENGLAYGHLHSGNLLFDLEQSHSIKLMDIANVITGISSKYRGYISSIPQIRTLEHCDVYSFGRVLYELSTGDECPTSTRMQFPNEVPIPVQHVLLKILAPTGDLPTIQQLLNDPLFQTATANNIERFQLKLSPKAKEAFGQISRTVQERLEGDQAKIRNAQRRTKASGQLMSDEERIRRRREKQLKAAGQSSDSNMDVRGPSKAVRSISVDPLQLTTGQTSPRRPLTPNLSLEVSNAPPVSPKKTTTTAKATPPPPPPPASDDRSQLLTSISDFSHAKLKKAKTNDRSAPKVK